MNIRYQASTVLTRLLAHRGSLKSLLPQALEHCPSQDRPLLQQMCYGVLRDYYRLDAIAGALLKRPFKATDQDLHALLLVGLYQLRSLRIPPHAAVNETVDAVGMLDKSWARSLFNGVLRRYQRESESIEAGLADNEQFRWNHPDWFIGKLRGNWPEQWQAILQANDCQAPMTLRVNKRKLTRERALELLHAESLDAQVLSLPDTALTLTTPCDTAKLPGFEQGYFSVQDQAAQFADMLLAAETGDRVLDACAAPGGKLCHLLEAHSDLGEVVAVEMEPSRIERMRDNLERLQLAHECKVELGDASARDWWDGQPFDRILVDAPCSGSGVIRRNPDIKLLRRNEDIAELARLQLNILQNLWGMLRPGGRLVYATCSVFPQENERIIERFVKLHADACIQIPTLPDGLKRDTGIQLFPTQGGHDGFFYAVLTRASTDHAESDSDREAE
ncbi:16S rRNA (cytosine(967)-C(5))-methyltransferase RsmB [Marinobacterium litorale]|uniref:16S rRNA (cytosine(967)-C(5))-methyltransferase RsmB n=1 Tax=Marinobacterium litorale TaxID=404770 RepID=UPI00040F9215|nr:16S rRNA (cytosine(967)-C(5))-methyltransferase RsmB [Marinobacterium litorale]